MSLYIFGRIGSLPLVLPYMHMMVICGNAKPRFITEHDMTPLQSVHVFMEPLQTHLPLLWHQEQPSHGKCGPTDGSC